MPRIESTVTKRFCIAILTIAVLSGLATAGSADFHYRLVYCQSSISRWPDHAIEHIEAAGAAGYNGVVNCDWALENLEDQKPKVFDNYKRAQAAAKAAGVEIIPWHFYQGQPAHENRNLAEAFPVKGTPFLVQNGIAKAFSAPEIKFNNPGFESGDPVPDGWKAMGTLPAIDKTIKHSGEASLRYDNPKTLSGLKQMIHGLKPFRAYELSVYIRTQGYTDGRTLKFQVLAGGFALLSSRQSGFGQWGINGNLASFSRYKVDFNTLRHSSIQVRLLATEGSATGSVWFDDVEIREVGLYETMRRRSCPITVKSEDGKTTYKEGTDYTVDPKCNSFDKRTSYFYEGSLTIPASGSAIKDGDKLVVDWYQLSNVETWASESDYCLPESWAALQDNLNRIDQLLGNSDFMYTNVDEWRVGAWNENCEEFQFHSGGDYMAKSWAKMECMMRKTGNGCRTIFTWNDMFDPYHNSSHDYGMVNNGTFGSWHGLGNDVIIGNWNGSRADKSLPFFMGKDSKYPGASNRQIVNVLFPHQVSMWINAIEKAEAGGGPKVVGMVWVTWEGDYTQIKPVADAFKTAGWWPNSPLPRKRCAEADTCKTVGIRDFEPAPAIQASPIGFRAMPTNSRTIHIDYTLSKRGVATIDVWNLQGKRIQTLMSRRQNAGTHRCTWHTSSIPAGVYILRLSTGATGRHTIRQILL